MWVVSASLYMRMHFVLHLQTNFLVKLVWLHRFHYGGFAKHCKDHGKNLKLNLGVKFEKIKVIFVIEDFFVFHSRFYESTMIDV